MVERLAKTMVELITNCNGSVNIRSLRSVFNLIKFFDGEYDDFSSDIEKEKYVEEDDDISSDVEDNDISSDVEEVVYEGDMDEDEDMIETDSKLIFDVYPLEEEGFVFGEEKTATDNEPIFDTYPLEEEFVFGGNEEDVIDDEPTFDMYPLVEEFMTKYIIEVGYKKKINFGKSYEQLIEKTEVEEMTPHEDSLPIENSIILITHIDFSLQVERKTNKNSMPVATVGKFSIHKKVSVGEL